MRLLGLILAAASLALVMLGGAALVRRRLLGRDPSPGAVVVIWLALLFVLAVWISGFVFLSFAHDLRSGRW